MALTIIVLVLPPSSRTGHRRQEGADMAIGWGEQSRRRLVEWPCCSCCESRVWSVVDEGDLGGSRPRRRAGRSMARRHSRYRVGSQAPCWLLRGGAAGEGVE